MGQTNFEQYDCRLTGEKGEYLTVRSIKPDNPEYFKVEDGVVSKQHADYTFTINVPTETLQVISGWIAATGGTEASWQTAKPWPFLNYDVSPAGQIPFVVTLVKVRFMIMLPEIDRIKGGGLFHDIKLFVGDVLVNGIPILQRRARVGIP